MSNVTAFPLSWPDGWQRCAFRNDAKFSRYDRRLTVQDGVARVLSEMEKMSARDIVISTNIETRRDGMPRSDRSTPYDPGAAVYWTTPKKERRCMAIDRYTTVADNLAAIAATLDAMRAIKRHGGAEILDRAFTGFVALPSPEQWWQVLGVNSKASREEIDTAYRRLAHEHHPDRGGSHDAMARINAARDQALDASR